MLKFSKLLLLTILFNGLFSQHFNVSIDDTGESTLFIFQDSIDGLAPGDEVGLFDSNGILDNPNEELQKSWGGSEAEDTLIGMEAREGAPNPKCTDVLCNPTYWVKERNLCLYCGHRS